MSEDCLCAGSHGGSVVPGCDKSDRACPGTVVQPSGDQHRIDGCLLASTCERTDYTVLMHLVWLDENDSSGRSAWDRAHASARASLQQHWAYGSAMQSFGAGCLRCVVMVKDEPRALAQLLVRRWAGVVSAALCTRGPVWLGTPPDRSSPTYNEEIVMRREAHLLIRKSLPLKGLRLVMFSPDSRDEKEAGVDHLHRVMTGYATVMLDLNDEPQKLSERLPGNWYNRLLAAQRSTMKVERIGSKPAQYQWLLDRDQYQQRQRGYRSLPKAFVPAFQRACHAFSVSRHSTKRSIGERAGMDAVFSLRADLGRTPVAAMMFLRHGDTATYHVGWSDPEQRLPGAHNLLLWNAMMQLRTAGVRSIDLGGVNTARSAGVARFKIGTGGEVVVLAGTYLAL